MPFNQKKEYQALQQRTNKYATDVSVLFSNAVNALLGLQKTYSLGEGEVFSFEDNPRIAKQASDILRQLHSATYAAISQGIKLEWAAGNAAADSFLTSLFGRKVLNDPRFAGWTRRNTDAMDAFFARTRDDGLTLSNRVWNTTKQLRKEMELAMTVSIGEGESASHISRQVRKYLQEPDRLFRRVREASSGNLRLSKAAAAYHPGQGVYRSSYKNAMRLARTEANMAYRTADNLRWEQMEFVTGIRINLSHNHPIHDICDELAGDYPKDFKFTGWHPQCFCYATPITCKEDEFVEMQKAILAGEEPVPPSDEITELPDNFQQWMKDNKGRVLAAERDGRLPYFLKDNWEKAKDVYLPPVKETAQWKAGNALLAKMEVIPDLDLSTLRHALAGKDLSAIEAATKAIQQVETELASTQYVDDAFEVAKKWGYKTTMGIEQSVGAKVQMWSSLPLEEQAKKLKFEAIDYLGGNMTHKIHKVPVQTLYPSWQVSQNAYLKQLGIVQEKIEWQAVENEFKMAKNAWSGNLPQPYVKAFGALDDAIHVKDMQAAKAAIADMTEWKALGPDIQKAKALAMGPGSAANNAYIDLLVKLDDVVFEGKLAETKALLAELDQWHDVLSALEEAQAFVTKSQPYKGLLADLEVAVNGGNLEESKVRLDALKAKRAELDKKFGKRKGKLEVVSDKEMERMFDEFIHEHGDTADDFLRPLIEKGWANMSAEERIIASKYTETYSYLNEPLRNIRYGGARTSAEFDNDMPLLESACRKNKTVKTMVVRRGTDDYMTTCGKWLGDLEAGDEFIDGGFLSSAVHIDYGFHREFEFIILVPKGAEGIYAEPFSHFTDSYKYSYSGTVWDGVARESMGCEREWIGQRGSRFRVVKKSGRRIFLQMLEQGLDIRPK